jgi:hypothetical protein
VRRPEKEPPKGGTPNFHPFGGFKKGVPGEPSSPGTKGEGRLGDGGRSGERWRRRESLRSGGLCSAAIGAGLAMRELFSKECRQGDQQRGEKRHPDGGGGEFREIAGSRQPKRIAPSNQHSRSPRMTRPLPAPEGKIQGETDGEERCVKKSKQLHGRLPKPRPDGKRASPSGRRGGGGGEGGNGQDG